MSNLTLDDINEMSDIGDPTFREMTGLDEAKLLHYNNKTNEPLFGYAIIGVFRDGFKEFKAYRNDDLESVLKAIDPQFDTYISQQSFTRQNRQAMYLASLALNYTDLDFRADAGGVGAEWLRRYPAPKDLALAC